VRRGAADRYGHAQQAVAQGKPREQSRSSADGCRRSGGGVEPPSGSVGQPGHPLGPKDGRQGLQQVGQPPGRDDGDAVGLQHAPGDAGAMHGDDRGNLDLGDAEDLVGLVGRPGPSTLLRCGPISSSAVPYRLVGAPGLPKRLPLILPWRQVTAAICAPRPFDPNRKVTARRPRSAVPDTLSPLVDDLTGSAWRG
jgi:hypothetical protein